MGRLGKRCVAGVEIGADALRVVVLDLEHGETLVDLREVSFSPESGPDEREKQLANLVEELDLKGVQAAFSVPSESARLNWLKLPRVRRSELPQVARYKLRDRLGESDQEFTLGIVPYFQTGEETIDSMIMMVPADMVRERRDFIASAGLKPVAAEIEAQALVRSAQKALTLYRSVLDQLSLTLVEFTGNQTRFVVIQNRRLQFVRTIRFGSNQMVRFLADSLKIEPEEASKLLFSRHAKISPNGEWTHGDVSVNLGPAFESLWKELRRLTSYFRSLRSERSYSGVMDRLMIGGDLACIPGLEGLISKQIGVRTHTLDPFCGIQVSLEGEAWDLAEHSSARFSTAYGLALAPHAYAQMKEDHHGRRDSDRAA